MNSFHELNMMTSRGDIKGALSLIRDWPEHIARKIMKKAGYIVPSYTKRAFWMWVQDTLTESARLRRSGWQVREESATTPRTYRQQAAEDYNAYANMMAQLQGETDITTAKDITVGPQTVIGTVNMQEYNLHGEDDRGVGDNSYTPKSPVLPERISRMKTKKIK
ncbi:hypothetical protein [Pantoea sp. At-9b]|uniref:hypothetical protein n=1 Tax=Pantoea sp. (strain At-9b) TaxID=592316 RepID=UPI0001B3EBE8|nr:hypothetical protein [Pantoea sp. At-9b]ADU72344.1 hypothetical protein Pat9b_5068 [Pantoea sp. At-9b]